MQIRDIAKSLKVSIATVSRALNSATESLVNPKTRKKIQGYAEKVRFVPSRTARGLSTGKSNTVGVILPTTFDSLFFNDHFTKVLAGLNKVLEAEHRFNCKLIVIPKGQSLERLEHLVFDSGVDGLLFSTSCDHALYSSHYFPKNLLAKWKRPVVVLGMKIKSSYLSCLYSSNYEAAKSAVTYLVKKGHKRIGIITIDPPVPDSEERYRGYISALEAHNLPRDKNLVMKGKFIERGESHAKLTHPHSLGLNLDAIESGYESALKFFQPKGARPTAIFCANDEMALGALKALRSLGIRCPSDVAVMGFDGIEFGEFVEPRLTTVSQPTKEMAESGTRLLLDLIEGKVKGQVSKFVPMELLVRESA